MAVPVHMAKILTYPEMVTKHNMTRLKAAISNGFFLFVDSLTIIVMPL